MADIFLKNMCIPVRYFALLLIILYAFGFMGVNDTPGSLQHAIINNYNISNFKFSLLYSVAAWPSCFGFINGFLIDRFFGVRLAGIIYMLVLIVGNTLFLIGGFYKRFDILIAGRVLYGLGADPLMLCLNKFVLHWFGSTSELNMVFALITCIPWLGSSLVFFMSNRIYEYCQLYHTNQEALGIALSASLSFSVFMAIGILILVIMYPTRAKEDKAAAPQSNVEVPRKNWQSILKFPFLFWIFSLMIILYFLAVMTFFMMSQEFFVKKYKMSVEAASTMASTFSLVTCFISSPIGFFVDKAGRNLIFISLSVFFCLLGHGLMAFSTSNPFAAVIILSISYALMTGSYLPLVSYLVEKQQVTTAYGIAQSGMNGSFAIGSLVAGAIISKYGYETLERMYFYLVLVTVPFWILIWIIDFRRGSRLNMTPRQRQYLDPQNNDSPKDGQLEPQEKGLVSQPMGISTPVIKRISITTIDNEINLEKEP